VLRLLTFMTRKHKEQRVSLVAYIWVIMAFLDSSLHGRSSEKMGLCIEEEAGFVRDHELVNFQ